MEFLFGNAQRPSWAWALTRTWASTIVHALGARRPALALDLAEEFRPLIADSCVLTLINNGEVGEKDFVTRGGACGLTADGRRKVLLAYERRLTTASVHPTFGYRVTYRRAIEVQARLLAAVILGELESYRGMVTR